VLVGLAGGFCVGFTVVVLGGFVLGGAVGLAVARGAPAALVFGAAVSGVVSVLVAVGLVLGALDGWCSAVAGTAVGSAEVVGGLVAGEFEPGVV